MKRYIKSLHTCLMAGVLVQAAVTAARSDALYPSTVLADGPVAYWRLNETNAPAQPVIANQGSAGTSANGVGNVVVSVPGGPLSGSTNTIVQFQFPASIVSVPWSSALNANVFSVELWVKPNPLGATCPISSRGATSGWNLIQYSGGWWFQLRGSSGEVYAYSASGTAIANVWQHVVGVFDGSNAYLYVNGVALATNVVSGFVFNTDSPMNFGAGYQGVNPFAGQMAEVAVYASALSVSDVQSHYQAATTNASGYATQILAASPVGYWRLNDTITLGLPVVNSGSAGARLNGYYGSAGAAYGAAGPQPPAESGFETNNAAVQFTSSYVGAAPLMLNTNTVTFEAWLYPTAAMNGYNGVFMAAQTGPQYGILYGNANALAYYWQGAGWDFESGLTPPLNQWSYVALRIYADHAVINMYDGITWSSATQVANHAVGQMTAATFIGWGDKSSSRYFSGSIDEPAVYGKTLTEGQARSHALAGFGSAAAPLFVYDPPVAAPSTIYVTQPFTVTSDAYGTPPLSFQWRLNGTNIAGATSAIFAKASSALTDSGNYDVIVTNLSGSITSSVVAVSINSATAATVAQAPADRQIYAGGRATFSVVAGGTAPFTYQWKHAGTNLPGATAGTLIISNVSAAAAGAYTVGVSNVVGGTISSPATLTIRTPTSPYESAVVAAGPEEYWHFDETGGTTAADYMSSYDASNQGSVTVGQAGPQPPAFAGFGAGNGAFS